MNKKFLSAILFGALMVTSTGTFVSCKDYDDDIKDLQTQINSNKDAIAALQKLVGEGNWVTGITSIADGFTVTMSNGQTTTVTGIKGEDGKNGVEWTIGEDGFWYKDGEKTAHQAVAKDGKPGVTAPSPSISADGKWVVYEWDATKGEFVAKTTEIPAQGTSAYVVKKDGVYVLHIADETGAFQDVTLPATSDSFVVEAPAALVKVNYDYAKWKPSTTNKAYMALLAQFPAIGEIEENTLLKQGGNLPVLVTPANVDLSEGFTFSLQDVKGKTADVEISNPTIGLPASAKVNGSTMTTRSAEASDCFWTLKVVPAIGDDKQLVVVSNTSSLVAENAKGTVVKTAFAYQVTKNNLTSKNIEINPNTDEDNVSITTGKASYASEIDLLAYDETLKAYPIYLKYLYGSYFIITPANAYEKERYGLDVEGQTLKIANMPSDVTSITVHLNVIALGLNGSAKQQEVTVTIGQEVVANGTLADKTVALTGKAQSVKWNIADLGLSAVELDKVLGAGLNMAVTREYFDANDNEHKVYTYNAAVKYYDAIGAVTTYNSTTHKWNNNKEGVTFGIEFNATDAAVSHTAPTGYTAEMWTADDYTVKLTSTESTGAVIYSAEATLTTTLPSALDSYIKLAPAFVENGILQVTGTVNGGKVTYDLKDALVLNGVEINEIIDLDYDAETVGDEISSSYNWMNGAANTDGIKTLEVNTWIEKNATGWVSEAKNQQLYKTRNIRAKVYFFGNPLSEANFDFKLVVKSTIFSTTPADVVTMDADKLVSNYGGDAIKVKDAIEKAVYAAGPKKGQAYNLFGSIGKNNKDVNDYSSPKLDSSDEYLLNSTGGLVEIAAGDLTKFGVSGADVAGLDNTKKVYLTMNGTLVGSSTTIGWSEIITAIDGIVYDYDENGDWKQKIENDDLTTDQAKYKALFDAYASKVAFDTKNIAVTPSEVKVGEGIANVTAEFVNVTEAAKYVKTNDVFEIKPLATTELTVDPKEVEIPMNLVITDDWGRTMKVPFNITVQTTKPE